MILCYLDASALAKRYVVELGTPLINDLFRRATRSAMACLTLGTAEVISIFVRKRNTRVITSILFNQAMANLKAEVVDATDFTKLSATDTLVNAATAFIERHSLNATDAVLLRSALDLAADLRAHGDDLVLVASDQRLLKAAQAEGLLTFDPEHQDAAALDTLLGPP